MSAAKHFVKIQSDTPAYIRADPSSFGEVFACMDSEDQVEVLRAMVDHMRPHRTQWDFIAIELEKPVNTELADTLRDVLFPKP